MFKRLGLHSWKLNSAKCEFFKEDNLFYPGYVVSVDGIQTDPSNTETVVNWLIPESTKMCASSYVSTVTKVIFRRVCLDRSPIERLFLQVDRVCLK